MKPFKRKFSTLIMLVGFVFVVLLLSIVIAAVIAQIMVNIGVLPPLSINPVNRFSAKLVFILIISLFVGTILTILGGEYMLRPLHRMIDATKEIASGNFDVQVEVNGSTEFSRLASSFNEMARELGSIETLRNDFISNISHEFKTPLVSIRGFAKRLKKNNLPEETRREYLDIIISETQRLSHLTSNVLLLSRLESTSRALETEVYALDEQIRRAILLMEPQFEKNNLTLDIRLEPVYIRANNEMINHIWINLLSNAIKFSHPGGVIRIALEPAGNHAKVWVKDNGIGMDEETKKHIFDQFYQGDRSRKTPGNGLGLSLVKRILQLSRGTIEVESAPDAGTCFTVLLPGTDGAPQSNSSTLTDSF